MRSAALLLVAATIVASADVATYKSALNMTIDPNTVEANTRAGWCNAQSSTCDQLCDANASTNDCDYSTLDYDCLCSSNKSAPGLQYYTQTMPTFICETLYSQCITENVSDADGQEACKTNIQDLCGTLDADDVEDSDSTSTAETTAAPTSTKSSSSDDSKTTDAVSTTTSDDFAAATAAPKAVAAMAALGLVAVLV